MKKFIVSILLFGWILSLLLLLLDRSTAFVIQKKANFEIKANPEYLVLGHSHSASAFNDSLIAGSFNASQNGEAYFYTYQKARLLLQQNPSLNTVFIEFANNQIIERMNDWTWGDKYLTNRYPRYAPFMKFSEQSLLARNNPTGFSNAYSISLKSRISLIVTGSYNYLQHAGGYIFLNGSRVDSLLNRNEGRNELTSQQEQRSEINIFYLRKTIDLCKANNKRVLLMRSPLHPKYKGYANEATFKTILQTEFNDVEFLDFSMFPLENHEFMDLEHLNYFGARRFSIWFNNILASGVINKSNIQMSIDSLLEDKKQPNL